MLTITRQAPHRLRGSAALEALMLVVFLIVPIWMLLFNMGYAGVRLQQAQVSTRLAAHEVVRQNTRGDNAQGNAANIADEVNEQVFPGEENVVGLSISEVSISSELGDSDGVMDVLGGLLAGMSGNTRVQVSVTRQSPFELFDNSDIEIPLTVGGTPFTYCEMDNSGFNPFDGEDVSLGILNIITGASNVMMAPFGGLPLGSDKC